MTNQTSNNYFVGGYVQDMTQVLIASLLSGENALLNGPPGWGKTDIALGLAEGLGVKASYTEIDPTTPVEVVLGAFDPAAMIGEGRMVRQIAGTPYDPAVRVSILDEIGRGSDPMFDALLKVASRKKVAQKWPVWGTTNFMPTGPRQAALIDRFALWHHITPSYGDLDVEGIVAAQLGSGGRPAVNLSGLPSWKEIEEVRTAQAGPQAINAIRELIRTLADEAAREGRMVHPRRVTQWGAVLHGVSVWETGRADYSQVPDAAAKMLRYAWPNLTPDEAATWREICSAVVDTVGAAIEEIMAGVVQEMRRVAGLDDMERLAEGGNLTQLIQSNQQTLVNVVGDSGDPRVMEAVKTMQKWLGAAISGDISKLS